MAEGTRRCVLVEGGFAADEVEGLPRACEGLEGADDVSFFWGEAVLLIESVVGALSFTFETTGDRDARIVREGDVEVSLVDPFSVRVVEVVCDAGFVTDPPTFETLVDLGVTCDPFRGVGVFVPFVEDYFFAPLDFWGVPGAGLTGMLSLAITSFASLASELPPTVSSLTPFTRSFPLSSKLSFFSGLSVVSVAVAGVVTSPFNSPCELSSFTSDPPSLLVGGGGTLVPAEGIAGSFLMRVLELSRRGGRDCLRACS